MIESGCNNCIPHAWKRTFVPGRGECCAACGRVIEEQELVLVTSASPPPRRHENPYGRGIRRDERGIPYLDENGQPLRLGEHFDPRTYGKGSVTIQGSKS